MAVLAERVEARGVGPRPMLIELAGVHMVYRTGRDAKNVFPAGNIAITLAGTVVLARLALIAPLRRAVRLKPGEAILYA